MATPAASNSRSATSLARFAWVDEYSYANRVRRQCMQELQPLCGQLRRQNAHACHIAARLGEAGDKTQIHRVIGGIKDDGNAEIVDVAPSGAWPPPVRQWD